MSIVKFMKPLLKQHKVDITIWLYLNRNPFNVSTPSEFCAIHEKHYDNYTVISWITFNDNVAHDYWRFFIACAQKLTRGIQQHYGDPFLHVMHDMVMLNDRNNYLRASVSFMVDFYLYRLAVALITNNVSHSSDYNTDLLQKILKETFKLDISKFTKSVASDTTYLATDVTRFLSPWPSKSTVKCTSWSFVCSMASEFAKITGARTC